MPSNSFEPLRRYNKLLVETDAVYHTFSKKFGYSDGEMTVLYTFCSIGDRVPLSKLCAWSGLSKQTIHSAVRKLERVGILYLEPADGKRKLVCLTEHGKVVAASTAGRVMQFENEVFDAWEKAEVEQYLRLTARFAAALREKANSFEREL